MEQDAAEQDYQAYQNKWRRILLLQSAILQLNSVHTALPVHSISRGTKRTFARMGSKEVS